MKTLLTAAALFFAGMAFSRNDLAFSNQTTKGFVGQVIVKFTDQSTDIVFVGGPGNYVFDIGSREVESLVFGTTVCSIGIPTPIHLQSGETAIEIIDPPKRKSTRSDAGDDDGLIYTSVIR